MRYLRTEAGEGTRTDSLTTHSDRSVCEDIVVPGFRDNRAHTPLGSGPHHQDLRTASLRTEERGAEAT